MRIPVFAAIGALVASPVAAEEATDEVRLAPASQWRLHYAENGCRLLRKFGTGEHEVTLYVEQYPPASEFMMVVAGEPVEDVSRNLKTHIQFGPNYREQEVEVLRGTSDDLGLALAIPQVSPDSRGEENADGGASLEASSDFRNLVTGFIATQGQASWLSLSARDTRLVLETGSWAEPFEAMNKCTTALLTHWGLDAEKHRRLTRAVQPLNLKEVTARLLTNHDGLLGTVQFRVIVDETGKVADCNVVQSTRPADLDEQVCQTIQRTAEFEPALDAQAQPVKSYYRTSAIFH